MFSSFFKPDAIKSDENVVIPSLLDDESTKLSTLLKTEKVKQEITAIQNKISLLKGEYNTAGELFVWSVACARFATKEYAENRETKAKALQNLLEQLETCKTISQYMSILDNRLNPHLVQEKKYIRATGKLVDVLPETNPEHQKLNAKSLMESNADSSCIQLIKNLRSAIEDQYSLIYRTQLLR